jgi:hypothetical protein
MSKHIKILIITAIFLVSISTKAQDKILFLNGKSLEGSLLEKTNYEFTFKNKKEKQFLIDKYRVFSYTQNNKESIVYEFDTLSGNFLKLEDMKMFVYGERDAYANFKPRVSNVLGLAIGAIGGYLMQTDESFIYIATPLIYTPITLLFPTKVKQSKITEVKYLKEDEYLRGYERVARAKRTQGALKTSLIGMGVGFLIGVITNGVKD